MSDRSLRLIKKALNVVVVIISSVTFRVVLMLFVKKAQSLLFRGHFFHLLAEALIVVAACLDFGGCSSTITLRWHQFYHYLTLVFILFESLGYVWLLLCRHGQFIFTLLKMAVMTISNVTTNFCP